MPTLHRRPGQDAHGLDDGGWSSQDDVFLDDDDCSCRDVAYLDHVGVESRLLTKWSRWWCCGCGCGC